MAKMHCADQGNGTYLNPVIFGGYGDHTVLKDGRDYYMTFGGGGSERGALMYHSRDLVNWEPVSNALKKIGNFRTIKKTLEKVRLGNLIALLTLVFAVPTCVSAAEIAVDAVEIAEDTNIVVAANDVLKIEYVYGENPVTVTKSGGGRLEIATSSLTNLTVVVAEGTFASARPQSLVDSLDFHPTIRIDANDSSKFTIVASGGTNFISRVNDADGGPRFLTNWGGSYHKPYVAEEKLNGMGLMDFGTYYGRDVPELAGGHGGNFGVNKVDGHDGFPLREYFYVWKDRDDIFDHPLIDGNEFTGPAVIGNNPGYFLRGKGGAGRTLF